MATPFDVTAKDEAAGGKSYQPNQRTKSGVFVHIT
jgi:hypothetical protein